MIHHSLYDFCLQETFLHRSKFARKCPSRNNQHGCLPCFNMSCAQRNLAMLWNNTSLRESCKHPRPTSGDQMGMGFWRCPMGKPRWASQRPRPCWCTRVLHGAQKIGASAKTRSAGDVTNQARDAINQSGRWRSGTPFLDAI